MQRITSKESSRELFIKQAIVSENPEIVAIGNNVKAGRSLLTDFVLYSIIDGSGKALLEFFQTQDREELGVLNVAGSRLEKGEVFMPDAFQILAANDSGGVDAFDAAKRAGLAYESPFIAAYPGFFTGEWEMSIKSQTIFPRQSLMSFYTAGQNSTPNAVFVPANPRILEDEAQIEFEIRLRSALPARTAVMLAMYGTKTIPARL